jgi:hypothetical protein
LFSNWHFLLFAFFFFPIIPISYFLWQHHEKLDNRTGYLNVNNKSASLSQSLDCAGLIR